MYLVPRKTVRTGFGSSKANVKLFKEAYDSSCTDGLVAAIEDASLTNDEHIDAGAVSATVSVECITESFPSLAKFTGLDNLPFLNTADDSVYTAINADLIALSTDLNSLRITHTASTRVSKSLGSTSEATGRTGFRRCNSGRQNSAEN